MSGAFIAIPCASQARYSSFWITLQELERPVGSIVHIKMGPFIVNNQNALARNFLQTDNEWFFLLNDDQIYPRDALHRLMAHDKDAVVGLSLNRRPPHKPLIYDRVDDEFVQHNIATGDSGLIPVAAAGGGSLLLKRSVFEHVKEPWWSVNPGPNGDHGGEDFAFCRKLHDAGIQLWCDLDLTIGHIADFAITPIRNEDGTWHISIGRTNS